MPEKILHFFALIGNTGPDTCAVFLGRHDINKTVKDTYLRSCYEKCNLNLHSLINKYFSDKFVISKFVFSELEQFYSSSEKVFFRVKVRLWQNNRVFFKFEALL